MINKLLKKLIKLKFKKKKKEVKSNFTVKFKKLVNVLAKTIVEKTKEN